MLDCKIEVSDLIAREIDSLSALASSSIVTGGDSGKVVAKYIKQVQVIHGLINPDDCIVLNGLLVILLDGLKNLLDKKKALDNDECAFLIKIPDILSEYLFIPSSRIPDVNLFNHFKTANWFRPITEEEESILMQSLMENRTDDANETTPISESQLDADDDLEIELSDLLATNVSEQNVPVMEDPATLDEKSELRPENREYAEEALDIADLSRYASIDSQDDVEGNEADSSDATSEPVSTGIIGDSASHTGKQSATGESDSMFLLSEEQQELIGLVIRELDEVANETRLNSADFSSDLKNHLTCVSEQIEKVSNAIELIGLEGLEYACRHLSGNIVLLADSKAPLSDEQKVLIELWPLMLLSYLHNVAVVKVSDDLVAYLNDPAWPERISDEAEAQLVTQLKEPQLFHEEKKLRQDTATPDDMSLDLPEDVNPELLEGLLQDLPVQSEEFSAAIQNLNDKGNLEHLEIAQRIAHTLKGAGNVVGVKGIANLTHHLEDILEIQSKAGKLPSKILLTVLIDAADCLETISEALLGIDEPPDNGLSVFQSVLDWANKLDVEGATDFNMDNIDDNETSQSPETALENPSVDDASQQPDELKSSAKRPASVENMLRVPASLADDLLRLAGENLISTSQIQEYIKTIQSRYVGLKTHNQSLQQLSLDLEHIVDIQGIVDNNNRQAVDDNFDPLELDQYHELHSMSRRLVEIAADSVELTNVLIKDMTQLNGLVINQDRLQKENEMLVLKTRMVPTKTIAPRLKRGVKQACRLTGKEAVLEMQDNDTYMDSEVLNSLIEPLMHLLRNSVDHGIESAEERVQANKSSRGSIKLMFSRKGDQIVIDIEDDGRGLSLEKIKEKSISLGLVTSGNEVTDANLKQFILQPGFSTSTEVTHVSGRGIGLDVVHSKIRELKGSIDVSSVDGSGCHFSLTLPASSFSIHSLLVRVRKYIYAFSNRGIEEILYPGLGNIEVIGHETVFKLDDHMYKTASIEMLLNMPEDRREADRENHPIILVKDDSGNTTAVQVQELIDSRDVVVKSMGAYIPKIQGIIGATVLGDGSIAPVIDLPELMQSASLMNDHLFSDDRDTEVSVETVVKPPYVLVVDDSLSARKSLAQFVQDLGLEVRTARDGLEAVSLIDARKPGLVLVDMEMPGMNGLELTSYIRASENVRDVPVIMITSRSTDKHRKIAMDKGVDHFMVKPFLEDELASHINLSLKIA